MPIRKPNLNPPFQIVRVSHVELGVRDLSAARAFYVDCLGLLVTEATADVLYLRGLEERNHHSIVLRKAREPRAETVAFKVASEEDLDRAAFWFGRNNLPTSFPEIPFQGRTLRTADVHGMPLDLYFRMDQAEGREDEPP
jgi:catechol 2,3-dioxygenase